MSNLSVEEMLAIANFGREIKQDDLRMILLPGRFNNIEEYDGRSYWILNRREIRTIVANNFTDNYGGGETSVYSLRIAIQNATHTKQRLIEAFQAHRHTLTQPELDFFTRSFTNRHRIPIFYRMPKVHKTPLQLRPVVSCINSFPSIFSTWLDFRMHELLHLIPSYIKNSTKLINDLKNLTLYHRMQMGKLCQLKLWQCIITIVQQLI